jgi:hypothetical protein
MKYELKSVISLKKIDVYMLSVKSITRLVEIEKKKFIQNNIVINGYLDKINIVDGKICAEFEKLDKLAESEDKK